MTCRAPTSSATCAGTQTGAQLSYDTEGRLASWQQSGTTVSYLYDGGGNRVQQQVAGSNPSLTTYVGTLEEVTSAGGATTTTTYYFANGQRIALAINGSFSYLASDGLGSATVALDANGDVQASVLYGPYGASRYSSGAMPGSNGFTGQHADAATGLDYYNARYYDPVAGQFTSADTLDLGGLNRYSYVGGNPETWTDPTGHMRCIGGCEPSSGGTDPITCQLEPQSCAPHTPCTSFCPSPTPTPSPSATPSSTPGPSHSTGSGGCHSDSACGGYAGAGGPPEPACVTVEQICAGSSQYDEYNLFNLMGERWAHGPISVYGLNGMITLLAMLNDLQGTRLPAEAGFEYTLYGGISLAAGAAAGFLAGPLAPLASTLLGGAASASTIALLKAQFDLTRERIDAVMESLSSELANIQAWDKQGNHRYDNVTALLTAKDTDTSQIPGLPGALYYGTLDLELSYTVPAPPAT